MHETMITVTGNPNTRQTHMSSRTVPAPIALP